MELPVRFPSETEVILEDVARFRALSPSERILTIQDMLADGLFLMGKSARAAWAERYGEEQENLTRQNIREFVARHAR